MTEEATVTTDMEQTDITAVATTSQDMPQETAPMKPPTKKQLKQMEKQQAQLIKNWKERNARAIRLQNSAVAEATRGLKPEDLKMLTQICTVTVPEQKDEQGNVTQKSFSYVNKAALISEARNAVALAREARILMGKRKRSTGRQSKRKAHRGAIQLLNNRLQAFQAQEAAAAQQATPVEQKSE